MPQQRSHLPNNALNGEEAVQFAGRELTSREFLFHLPC
jgi:hypothetical protein